MPQASSKAVKKLSLNRVLSAARSGQAAAACCRARAEEEAAEGSRGSDRAERSQPDVVTAVPAPPAGTAADGGGGAEAERLASSSTAADLHWCRNAPPRATAVSLLCRRLTQRSVSLARSFVHGGGCASKACAAAAGHILPAPTAALGTLDIFTGADADAVADVLYGVATQAALSAVLAPPAVEELGEPEGCEACGKEDDEDAMLLCDGCPRGFHMHCLSPKLTAVPEGDWFCPLCATAKIEKEAAAAAAAAEAAVSPCALLPALTAAPAYAAALQLVCGGGGGAAEARAAVSAEEAALAKPAVQELGRQLVGTVTFPVVHPARWNGGQVQ